VRFASAVQALLRGGFDAFVELSPHPVLYGPILEGIEHAGAEAAVVRTLQRDEPESDAMLATLGALHVAGHSIRWSVPFPQLRSVARLPRYPWQRQRYWVGASGDDGAGLYGAQGAAAAAPDGEPAEENLAWATPERRRELVRTTVRRRVARILGVDPDAPLDGATPFRDLGMRSVMLIELGVALARVLDVKVPQGMTLSHPTIDQLSAALYEVWEREHASGRASVTASSDDVFGGHDRASPSAARANGRSEVGPRSAVAPEDGVRDVEALRAPADLLAPVVPTRRGEPTPVRGGKGFAKARRLVQRFLAPPLLASGIFLVRFGARVSPRAEVELSPRLRFGRGCAVSSFTKIKASDGPLVFGDRASIATCCFIHAGRAGLRIGDDFLCGPNVNIVSSNYSFESLDVPLADQGIVSQGIRIGHNVWVGAGATILDGTEIGDNTIVGAGAVCNGRYPPNVILDGNPARAIPR
jgi:acetyltransferase-like isoleucine patch superfamily enzyme/acyl carrier protein